MYSSTLPSASALDGGGWSTSRPGRFTPGNDPVPIVQEAAWVIVPVWRGAENLAPTGIRSPYRPARSEKVRVFNSFSWHLESSGNYMQYLLEC
jgi:hypothetical protein